MSPHQGSVPPWAAVVQEAHRFLELCPSSFFLILPVTRHGYVGFRGPAGPSRPQRCEERVVRGLFPRPRRLDASARG